MDISNGNLMEAIKFEVLDPENLESKYQLYFPFFKYRNLEDFVLAIMLKERDE